MLVFDGQPIESAKVKVAFNSNQSIPHIPLFCLMKSFILNIDAC
jgi:hypothetical protein